MRLKLMISFFLLAFFTISVEAEHKKVRLADVQTITLKKGEFTTGRRSSPVPQLKCVGGSAAGHFSPRVAQCTKTGHDGVDYQWKCTAEMPKEYEFGKISVTCEGFDYPDDPYILHGSCGLEYDLEFSDKRYSSGSKQSSSPGFSKANDSAFESVVTFIVVAFIIVVAVMVMSDCFKMNARRAGGAGGSGPGYPPGGPGFGPPPPYDDNHQKPSSSQQQNDGPGFWTGAGLGALGGYFMGRNQGGGARERNFYAATGGRERTPSPPRRSSSAGSSGTHVSTGYGETRRR